MDVSIIISTWNNSARLAKTLDAIGAGEVSSDLSWELIVVNNNCTDETDAVVASFASRLPIRYEFEPHQGTSRGKNAGLRVAAGNLTILTDDDVTPGPEWIATYWSAFQERPRGYFFGGPVDSEFEALDFDQELLASAPRSVCGLSWGDAPKLITERAPFLGANWACPTEALRELGGFDPRLGLGASSAQMRVGEESQMMVRLTERGWQAWYLPTTRIKHFVPRTKCSLEHLSERAEATGFYFAIAGRQKVSRVFGASPMLYLGALHRLLKWGWARGRGRKAYLEYLQWRHQIGLIRGARELPR